MVVSGDRDEPNHHAHENLDSEVASEVAAENRDDEFIQPDPMAEEERVMRTRPGMISRPYDCATKFLEIEHYQSGSYDKNGRWVRPFCYDDVDMTEKLSTGM